MDKRITFFIASNTGQPVKHMTFPRRVLITLCFVFVASIFLFGYVVYDYSKLKRSTLNTYSLEKKMAGQAEEINSQRKQIQTFAKEINILKTEIVELNSFESKIRVIANIEKTADQDGVFGVGGSIPEDLNPNISIEKKHNSLLREMHDQVSGLNQATTKQKDGFQTLLQYLQDQRNLLASTPAICPTKGWVTSKFGYRTSPFTGLKEFHKGLDIATRKGTPVIATADGVVSFSGKKGFLGKVVSIDHGHGVVSRYAHLSKMKKKQGEKVKRGDIIGLVGSSGRSTGPHLHYDVRVNGVNVNPEKYILN